ncbi:MAG TPA: acyl carrier protein, partial [Caulobacterales bacterium]|nr:acyl carrier protein [Caulobacterales bacterium]
MDTLLQDVTAVVRDVFADDEITLSQTTTADDVEGWDSLMHLNLIIAIEKRFKIKFSTAEISGLKEEGSNVGDILRLIAA